LSDRSRARTVDLPPVEAVRPGLWSLPVPIPNNPLRYVLVYAFETSAGFYLVDAGWNADASYRALCDGLVVAGGGISDVKGVLVTHMHPDHFGLAPRVREASGAWVALHPADAALLDARYAHPDRWLDATAGLLRRAGAPPSVVDELRDALAAVRPAGQAAGPDRDLEDGQRAEVPGWDVRAIWTPGHSPGHVSFYEQSHDLLFSGDHVLPVITPNIGVHAYGGDDPLADYLGSLARVREYETAYVLPAHEHRFSGLAERVDALVSHHEQRFTEVLAAVAEGATAWDVAKRMEWSIPWERITGLMVRSAVAEAMAHLRALERRGMVQEHRGEPSRWTLSAA
jgi:glyoxylase-like metal-dependent hydrolase (beta-lactamase superfamily II)